MNSRNQLLACLTALTLNGPAAAAPLAYGSNEAFISSMEKILQGTKASTAGSPAPRAVLVHDTAAFKKHIQANLKATVTVSSQLTRISEPQNGKSLFDWKPKKLNGQSFTGSGAILTKDGYILTNNHVVTGAVKITVTLNDKREFPAILIGVDPATDIAVLKIAGDNLPTIRLGNSDKLEVGDMVVAIGAPLGLDQTMTDGKISAFHRELNVFDYEDFIQINAAINPGNSGGPLFHGETGEFIGLNHSILSPTGTFMGIGFAIPAAVVKEISSALIKRGKVVRSQIGIALTELLPARRDELKVPWEIQGVEIEEVPADSPNIKSGLAANDVIVGFSGTAVTNPFQLRMAIARMPPGSVVPMTVWRKGKTITVKVICAPKGKSKGSLT